MKDVNLVALELESTSLDSKKEPIVVTCAADDNYMMPLAVTIRSALENLGKDRRILLFIIDGDIKERSKQRFLRSINLERCEVRWIPKPDKIINEDVIPTSITSGLPEISHITIAAWYRLLIPKLLPQHIKKAIYLDCDLVVVGDLGKLWDIDIASNYLLAVARLKSYEYRTIPFFLKNWKELGFSEDNLYFNSGILVFNLEKWRINDMSSKSLEYIKLNQEYIRWGDQDVLNAIVVGSWGELDPRWNCMNTPQMKQEEVDNSFILHFATPPKPWVALEEFPAKDSFFRYLKLTSWSGYRQSLPQRIWRKFRREVKKIMST
ncbi:glycosyl transferase, family 8 [Pseudanabaena sp. lw0831]|uniref:glycosyltransferase family 8 protein n=1 Tax=Pseudanabaena sp. lw0831 TaxID=1357935 RepID=UPI001914FB9A|nr:glycosyltransferase family 8 protein [Pseudanabaena sp. lw0831]GBO51719.1 glycosyl transferase, family 8 [Pseudanabaena sp. lw0831]